MHVGIEVSINVIMYTWIGTIAMYITISNRYSCSTFKYENHICDRTLHFINVDILYLHVYSYTATCVHVNKYYIYHSIFV